MSSNTCEQACTKHYVIIIISLLKSEHVYIYIRHIHIRYTKNKSNKSYVCQRNIQCTRFQNRFSVYENITRSFLQFLFFPTLYDEASCNLSFSKHDMTKLLAICLFANIIWRSFLQFVFFQTWYDEASCNLSFSKHDMTTLLAICHFPNIMSCSTCNSAFSKHVIASVPSMHLSTLTGQLVNALTLRSRVLLQIKGKYNTHSIAGISVPAGKA